MRFGRLIFIGLDRRHAWRLRRGARLTATAPRMRTVRRRIALGVAVARCRA